jgi:hypothetical protein
VWTKLGNRDFSDKEWEEEFNTLVARNHVVMNAKVDTRGMVHDAFQQTDNTYTIEDIVQDKAMMAFMVANTVHEECRENSSDSKADAMDFGGDAPNGDVNKGEEVEDSNFDLRALEDAITPWYASAKCLKLAVT